MGFVFRARSSCSVHRSHVTTAIRRDTSTPKDNATFQRDRSVLVIIPQWHEAFNCINVSKHRISTHLWFFNFRLLWFLSVSTAEASWCSCQHMPDGHRISLQHDPRAVHFTPSFLLHHTSPFCHICLRLSTKAKSPPVFWSLEWRSATSPYKAPWMC